MKATVAYICDFAHPPALIARAQQEFNFVDENQASQPEVSEQIQAVITNSHVGVPSWVWELPNLKILSCYGVGYDGIDTAKAQARGIWVSNTPTVLNEDVADMAMAMILAIGRDLLSADRFVRAGKWSHDDEYPLVAGVTGKKLGLLGMGGIGQAIAKRAEACDLQISYHCRTPKEVPYNYEPELVTLAKDSDILCLIVPGGEATKHLVNAEVLTALGPTSYLVNIARGSVVDEQALIKALTEGQIAGAALDVYANEPHVPAELKQLDNVILLPHIGSASVTARSKMGNLAIDNICDVLAEQVPRTAVNEVNSN